LATCYNGELGLLRWWWLLLPCFGGCGGSPTSPISGSCGNSPVSARPPLCTACATLLSTAVTWPIVVAWRGKSDDGGGGHGAPDVAAGDGAGCKSSVSFLILFNVGDARQCFSFYGAPTHSNYSPMLYVLSAPTVSSLLRLLFFCHALKNARQTLVLL
jgi:hypothetical protein